MLQEALHSFSSTQKVFLGMGCLLLLWRIWTFTVKPWLEPTRPKEIPYWIPVIGHTYDFFWNSVELNERGLNYTKRTHEPFAIQLPGKKIYVVTSPGDVVSTFNNSGGLDTDFSLRELLTSFGVSKKGIELAWHKPMPGDWCYIPNNPINPEQRCFIKFVEHIYRTNLLSGSTMQSMREVFKNSVCENLRLENLAWCTAGDETSFSLHTLVRHIVVEGATKSLFGTHLHDIDPRVVEYMLHFNDYVWQLVMRYPDFFFYRSAVSEPYEKLLSLMRRFAEVPAQGYKQVNLLIHHTLVGMENTGLDTDSRARMLLMMFWASVSNEHNSTFWLLAHLLYDKDLLYLVEQEVEGAWQSGDLDFKHLNDNCPNLEAAFNEVLRVKNAAGSMRVVNQEVTLSGKVISPGNVIHIPFRQLHTNEDVWGSNPLEFDHVKFLKKKFLTRSPSFRPFGGGESYCPGRTLAKQEVFSVVATLLHRFHVRLAWTGKNRQPFPIINDRTPSLGLNGPIDGMDVIVNLRERQFI